VCKGFKWRLHNAEFKSDMMLIPLVSCDVVLGVQWLSQLGTVRWNFKKLYMEFTYQGRDHVLRGMRGKKLQMIGNNKLQKLLDSTPQLCMLQVVEVQHGYGEFCSSQLQGLEPGKNKQ